jgi:Icc-related predicted phosphoesterase
MSKNDKIRVAAVGDIHVREGTDGNRQLLQDMGRDADILVLCGDLTNRGLPAEARSVVDLLASATIPIVAVLGNHDYECGHQEEVEQILRDAGIHMLDPEPCEIQGVGFAGVKGFAGGFDRHMLAPWGEELIKEFVRETVEDTLRLEGALGQLRTKHKIAVLHYAPIRTTVEGEPPEIFAFLGSSRLVEPIDRFGVTAVVHGHAHHGTAEGQTLTGIPVYNVALPLMQEVRPDRPYVVLEL